MKYTFLLMLSIFVISTVIPVRILSEELTLSECRKLARDNYPDSENLKKLKNTGILENDNLNTAYYPQISLYGQTQYQSDVTKIDVNLNIPGMGSVNFPEVRKDQYQIGVNLNQLIWDSGIISARKKITSFDTEIEINKVRSGLRNLDEIINSLFFKALELRKLRDILKVQKNELNQRITQVDKLIKGGILPEVNGSEIQSEEAKIEIRELEIESGLATVYASLAGYTGKSINDDTELKIPVTVVDLNKDLSRRPEIKIFENAKEKLKEGKHISDAALGPKIAVYARAGYGLPGLNMFADKFSPFFLIGLNTSWNLLSWGKNSNEKEIIDSRSEIIDNNEATFKKNLNLALDKLKKQIDLTEGLIEKDKKLLKLKEQIAKVSSSKLDNGIITSTDYLHDFNALNEARISLELRKIKLTKTKNDYLTLTGADYE